MQKKRVFEMVEMDKITGLGVLDVIFGVWLIFSELVPDRENTFAPLFNKVGVSWSSFVGMVRWSYLPASAFLIVTGILLVGYTIILR